MWYRRSYKSLTCGFPGHKTSDTPRVPVKLPPTVKTCHEARSTLSQEADLGLEAHAKLALDLVLHVSDNRAYVRSGSATQVHWIAYIWPNDALPPPAEGIAQRQKGFCVQGRITCGRERASWHVFTVGGSLTGTLGVSDVLCPGKPQVSDL
jgi:hypothetical protein